MHVEGFDVHISAASARTFSEEMTQNNSNNVVAAFDTLIEEIEVALHSMNQEGASAFEAHHSEMVHKALEHAQRVVIVCEKASSLKEKWNEIEGTFGASAHQRTPNSASVQRKISMHSALSKPGPMASNDLVPSVGRLIAGRIS